MIFYVILACALGAEAGTGAGIYFLCHLERSREVYSFASLQGLEGRGNLNRYDTKTVQATFFLINTPV